MALVPKNSPQLFDTLDARLQDRRRERRFQTIVHAALDMESAISPIPDGHYRLVDRVLAEAESSITVGDTTSQAEAERVLSAIEDILIRNNFVSNMPEFVHAFRDGLARGPIRDHARQDRTNARRRSHIDAHLNEEFSHFDCDIGSVIYLSFGEVLGLPLSMVEVPLHNFIRWRLPSSNYNWETLYGFQRYTDRDYQLGYGVSPEQIARGTYLRNLDRTEVAGYLHFARGNLWTADRFLDSISDFQTAITSYPASPTPRNNLAWLYVTNPGANALGRGQIALQLALAAVDLHRTPNFLDTLATVYAAIGDFANAITTETEAFNASGESGYAHMIRVFEQDKTYLKHQEEKETVLAIIVATGNQGITHANLLTAAGFPETELNVIIAGLQLDNSISVEQVGGEDVYRAHP